MRALCQIIGHGAIEESVVVTELTTNGALGIPRGLVSTWGLVAVEAILEPTSTSRGAIGEAAPANIRFDQAAPNTLYQLPQEELFGYTITWAKKPSFLLTRATPFRVLPSRKITSVGFPNGLLFITQNAYCTGNSRQ